MSMTTSRPNVCRYSTASRATQTAASGSSPFTWKIGAWIIFATSVQYSLDRDASGAVVNPTWLLMITCTVPPVRYPRSRDRLQRLGDHALAGERGVAVQRDAASR